MKLELTHIAPYLPYGLMVNVNDSDLCIKDFTGEISSWEYYNTRFDVWNEYKIKSHMVGIENIKPILRPLSSMTVEEVEELNSLIDDSVRVVVSSGKWVYIESASSDPWDGSLSLDSINIINEYLFKNHFDVFNLVDKNLAIDKTAK